MKITFTLLLCFFSFSLFAVRVPELKSAVNDNVNLLSPQTKNILENQIRNVYNKGAGPQVAVLIIETTRPEELSEFANKVFNNWALGDKQRDDGVLFIIAKNDRKMRIESGQGVEGSLTDYTSKQIINKVTALFKQQDFDAGVRLGVTEILNVVTQPDAVQGPAPVRAMPESIPTRETNVDPVREDPVSRPRVSSAERDIELGGLFFAALVIASVAFSVYSIVQLVSDSRELKEVTKEVSDLEKKEKHTLKELSTKLKVEILRATDQLSDVQGKLSQAKIHAKIAPRKVKENLEFEVRELEGEVSLVQRQNREYETMIKEGR